MLTLEEVKARILEFVSNAKDQKVRPRVLERTVMKESARSVQVIRQALNDLMREERLIYTYRDPCSFVEVPERVSA